MPQAYWALGGVWPGQDRESLARTVVGGSPGMRFPGRTATWGVVAVQVVGAGLVLSASGLVAPLLPAWPIRTAALGGAGVLFTRGVEGIFDARLRPDTAGSPFARLNVALCSPRPGSTALVRLGSVQGNGSGSASSG